jgi:hypothetical protein
LRSIPAVEKSSERNILACSRETADALGLP